MLSHLNSSFIKINLLRVITVIIIMIVVHFNSASSNTHMANIMGESREEAEGHVPHSNHPSKFVLLIVYLDEKLKSYKGIKLGLLPF